MAEFPQNMHKHRHIQAVKWSNPNTRQDDPTLAQWPATVVIEKRWENSPLTRWAAPPCWHIGQQMQIHSQTYACKNQYTIWQTSTNELKLSPASNNAALSDARPSCTCQSAAKLCGPAAQAKHQQMAHKHLHK